MSIAIKAAAFEWAWDMIPPIFLRHLLGEIFYFSYFLE